MRTRKEQYRELLLEVERNGFRCLLYRSTTASGREVFMEESDLPDCSRPQSDDLGYPMHFSMKEAWAAITGYTSPEGLWASLHPVFVHSDLRPLVQRSLAQVTRDASLSHSVTKGIGQWLRALTIENAPASHGLFNHVNTYRHAS